MKTGTLYVVSTPIGNLGDITLRALDTLKQVDIIAAEDTRHTVKLLNHYDIKNKLLSYHEFSETKKEDELMGYLLDGLDIALVSDAGTPLISDPGADLVRRALDEGVSVIPIPGVSAVITALSVSGLLDQTFHFEGFLPTKESKRTARLSFLEALETPIVLYEAPHRIHATLKSLSDVFEDTRKIVISREMTKLHEEFIRGPLSEVINFTEAKKLKGEMVIVIDGKTKVETQATDEAILAHLKALIDNGATKKDAVKETASELHTCKNRVYQLSLRL